MVQTNTQFETKKVDFLKCFSAWWWFGRNHEYVAICLGVVHATDLQLYISKHANTGDVRGSPSPPPPLNYPNRTVKA